MILSDSAIAGAIQRKEIVIEPFDMECLGSNSYDVHLGPLLTCYNKAQLDSKKDNETINFTIPDYGLLLTPGRIYLGSTVEYTESHKHVPFLDGKSSIGRLGIFIHATAGRGDVGFCNHWTLELIVTQPVTVYAGMKIGQLFFYETKGRVMNPYNKKKDAKYTKVSSEPQSSQMHLNFKEEDNADKKQDN